MAKKHEDVRTQQTVKVHRFISDCQVIIAHLIAITAVQLNADFFFSAHIQTTLDLPDLDFSGALRETTSRMENIMGSTSRATTSTQNPSRKSSSGSSTVGEGFQRSHTTLH